MLIKLASTRDRKAMNVIKSFEHFSPDGIQTIWYNYGGLGSNPISGEVFKRFYYIYVYIYMYIYKHIYTYNNYGNLYYIIVA